MKLEMLRAWSPQLEVLCQLVSYRLRIARCTICKELCIQLATMSVLKRAQPLYINCRNHQLCRSECSSARNDLCRRGRTITNCSFVSSAAGVAVWFVLSFRRTSAFTTSCSLPACRTATHGSRRCSAGGVTYVYCRMERDGENICVRDWHHLQSIVHGGSRPSTALAAAVAGWRPDRTAPLGPPVSAGGTRPSYWPGPTGPRPPGGVRAAGAT